MTILMMANGKSDIPFPPMEELLRATRRKDAEPGSVAGVGMYLKTSILGRVANTPD